MKKILILLIRFYQKYLSPMKRTRCPYYPTCSCYGLEAIEKHGAIKGSILAGWRILRCNPFSHGGIDPVPENFMSFRRNVQGHTIMSIKHGQLGGNAQGHTIMSIKHGLLGGKKIENNVAHKK